MGEVERNQESSFIKLQNIGKEIGRCSKSALHSKLSKLQQEVIKTTKKLRGETDSKMMKNIRAVENDLQSTIPKKRKTTTGNKWNNSTNVDNDVNNAGNLQNEDNNDDDNNDNHKE